MNQDNPGADGQRANEASMQDGSATRRPQAAGGGKGRGFAGMDPQKQRAIASEGGKAAHASGNAHEFNSEEARRAGALSHGGRGRNAGPAASSGRPGTSGEGSRNGPNGGER